MALGKKHRLNQEAKNWLEVKEFLETTDFYLTFTDYSHYTNKEFDTSDLTITEILKICESYILSRQKATYVVNDFDVERAVSLVLHRIETCDDEGMRADAFALVEDMPCYTYKNNNVEDDNNSV